MLPEGVDIDQNGQWVTVHFALADVTHTVMQEVVVECTERMRYNNGHHFIFDLEGVEFLASACLGSLVSLLQDVEHVRGRIALANCSDNVGFLFKVTRLDHVFTMCDDPSQAKAG